MHRQKQPGGQGERGAAYYERRPSSSPMAFPKKKLRGLVAATITPMTENGEINFSVIGQYVDYLVKEQGVKNIFVNGTTGEGLSLSVSERRQVAEEWVSQGRNKLDQVVIHVGALNLKESQELAQHAAEIGADGIAVIAPFFFKSQNKETGFLCVALAGLGTHSVDQAGLQLRNPPASASQALGLKACATTAQPKTITLIDALISFLREVAAAAPALPFYYYHIPSVTGVKIRAEELLDGIQDKIPTFQGLKFSDTDLLDFGQCVDQNHQRQFALLFGVDEQLLSALIMGATGAVGSTYNYLGKKTNQMLEAFEQKDFASALSYQFCIQRFINYVIKLATTLASNSEIHLPLLPKAGIKGVCATMTKDNQTFYTLMRNRIRPADGGRGFGVSQTKAIMTLVSGIPMGPPRLPLQKASQEFTANAEAKLKSLNFLSFPSLKDGNLEACS
ncbi:N-acetylneuraminate lyase [Apodemus speciosus]|uniref:N-acetylneuraminate lyase n=1 Tax=Apodemus speciosus TaxID=105296 RepID=A0ABQ0EF39_APOSI